MNPLVRKHLAAIGRVGGRESRRVSADAARAMVKVREARIAYRQFHPLCFWSSDPEYKVTIQDVPWVAKRLMEFGGRQGWERGANLLE